MTTKERSNKATHSGTCQICGHFQKLPNGRLSLHGYTVQWNCFVGDCTGSRYLPFEVSIDQIQAAIRSAIKQAEGLRANAPSVRADRSPKGVEMTVWASDLRTSDGKRVPAYSGIFGPKSSNMTVRGDLAKVGEKIEFRFTRGGVEYVYTMGTSQNVFPSTTVDSIVAKVNAREAEHMLAIAKQCDEYVAWQRKRIANWKPTPEKLVPVVDEAPTVHAIGEYWTKRSGRPIALCVSSIRAAGYKPTTTERANVTCKACLKRLAADEAAEIEATKANALIAEMVAKYGQSTTEQFSDANGKAIKEIRYNRKELDKGVRKLATDRLERGIR